MAYTPLVFTGPVRDTARCGRSAIEKRQTEGVLQLGATGLAGDEQAEKAFHGGPDRALCHYPREHYDYWKMMYPEIEDRFVAPFFGENISTLGMTEDTVFIGDIYQWGGAVIQITQPRSPCYKLNPLTDVSDFALVMQDSGRTGWLYRVIGKGEVSGLHPLKLLTRTSAVSVREAVAIAFHLPFDETEYRRLLHAPGLSASWTLTMQRRLTSGKIEDFNRRLFGFAGPFG
ncbi:6-hydroxyaminopurine reductase [Morganella morganii]|uniref:6-hydroxyaminopurine reductase n=1 Tax=Morganella morganii TaxID=582 RepID=A0A9Q4GSP5_MORMO|nr:6-hydroxyaminopurine reductase [Morganella morganii]BEP23108.1 6-hydroxyaminopurine reductase [Morganella morganii subsp. sibonii]EJD6039973.1 6-N-hydroxylaminopurine resistance protein [Morganella morganii]EKK5569043.1 6-N-hydroxylaminopurine resistance protein [Morganella morganii]EKU5843481.1 6-N-hydroxylaminopurine resistance protein [Morganella morganii]ELB1544196.1 6-N-hydroxylaminopurine resistance protein [Morganella morganii]